MTKYYIGDTHFGHTNAWEKFKRPDGQPLRPFTSTEEMDETMIQNWNKIVKPQDTVIHMGDVVINRKSLQLVHRLNGHKRLVRGNHDIFDMQDYIDVGFEEIYGSYVVKDTWYRVICTHIPIHKASLERWTQNWHGHLHFGYVEDERWRSNNKFSSAIAPPDHQYRNLSCEMINFTPISHDQLLEEMRKELKIK